MVKILIYDSVIFDAPWIRWNMTSQCRIETLLFLFDCMKVSFMVITLGHMLVLWASSIVVYHNQCSLVEASQLILFD